MKKTKKSTDPLLPLSHEIDKWKERYSTVSDNRIMVFLLNLARVSKFTIRERLNKNMGTTRYQTLLHATRNILEQIGEDPAKIKAEVWYNNTDSVIIEIQKAVNLNELSCNNLFQIIKELAARIPKDYIKLELPAAIKKPVKPAKLVEQPVKQKTPAIVIKKKIKLPPKIIIVE